MKYFLCSFLIFGLISCGEKEDKYKNTTSPEPSKSAYFKNAKHNLYDCPEIKNGIYGPTPI